MIDLKKEIEDNQFDYAFDDFRKGYNAGLNIAIKTIDQYNIGELSDGYHTFNSLYEQRMYLFATIVNQNKDKAWKSYKHEDGELCFGGGWFIVGVDTPNGSYTYHYENKYYDLFECEELECGKHWDGHTDKDVDRVLSLANYNIITAPKTIKLSEIISKLNEKLILETDYKAGVIRYGKDIFIVVKKPFRTFDGVIAEINSTNKIVKIDEKYVIESCKWLYALWITGTIIEDDLQEE